MCGIAGIVDRYEDLSQKLGMLSEMSKTLTKRGPDENGIFIDHNTALIHRRLVVIDKENGKQPMMCGMNNEKYIIVYNGELYNTEELRADLKSKGYTFKGHSDTEVVLKSYIEYGENCAGKLNGIFAFAVYEMYNKKLYMCRDRIGVKPFFYSEFDSGIVFGSEIKALLKSGKVKPVIDEEGLCEIFFLGPARTPGSGVFKNIKELLPGEYAVYEGGRLRKKRYFRLEAKEFEDSEEQAIERVRYLLTDAIEKQLVSDVPLCFFLSGGLDSSIIVQSASNFFKRNNSSRITTYSVEYRDNMKYFEKSLFQPTADVEFIKLMSQNADTIHREVIIDNEQLADALYDSVLARDLPGYVDVDSSLLLFCGEIKKEYTVALSGECADELFGGYPWYHNRDILFEDCFPWSRSQDIRRSILKKGVLLKGEEYVREKYLDTIRSTEKLSTDTELTARMREMFSLNYYWFMQCLLERKDRCSMYSGLEVRVPFCDYRIVEYAYNMPWEIKAYRGREKGIVRKAFEDILPYDIVWRKKSPYPKTHNPVYMEICAERVEKILGKDTALTELLSKEGIERIIENPEGISSPWYGQLMKAPQILAYIIELDYWFEEYGVRIEGA
ncbi:MAG: asparagine synthase (glutamine-hydrolyzing) [Ruminococcus sp.]|nr:asparagine synthase (glutamine-hydrolyzing) [Ruminococcus sp.]